MKATVFVLMILLALPGAARAVDCNNPCGPEELITCAAQDSGMSAEDYFNKALFNIETRDKYCKDTIDSSATVSQKYFHENYCNNTDTYYSYNSFITAAKSYPKFLCQDNTTKEMRYRELANFLATVSQETTGGEPYTTSGLRFRYEYGALNATSIDGPTTYGENQLDNVWFVLSTDGTIAGDTLTTKYWNTSPGSTTNGNGFYTSNEDRMQCLWHQPGGANGPLPLTEAGYTQMKMVDLLRGTYWVGMGPKQLTADSLMGFFGWYYQHLASNAPVEKANFRDFTAQYLTDGVLAFQGAVWYWTKRINGNDNPPVIADMFTDSSKTMCHDIGIVTYMVNGGCNDHNKRKEFYTYFLGTVFHIEPTNTCNADKSICSMDCSVALYNYCK